MSNRMLYSADRREEIEAERTRLVEFLSEGDYYSKWSKVQTDNARAKVKQLSTTLLNMANNDCTRIPLYRHMASTFPRLFSIIEDIKRKDHRNLSKQLQRFTSDAINGALLQLQREDVPAIPDTDAILCRERDRMRVSGVIGAHVHAASGVLCKVAGIRFNVPSITPSAQ
jgi:ribosomal 50S subunit-associated protein YjgA (DUF615 family)